MTPQVTPLKVSPDDLPDLDKKTREGLAPMFDDLNVFANQVVQAIALGPQLDVVSVYLQIDASVAAAFPLLFRSAISKPRAVLLGNVQPKDPDHVLTTPFVMQGFSITDAGLIAIPSITGLLVSNAYSFTFLVV